MITINATGDTTLHTAGKYCTEDILVKVPAGGSSGGSVETCNVTITADSIIRYGATKYVNGTFVTECESGYGEPEITIDNVVKGSCLAVVWNMYSMGSAAHATNCTEMGSAIANMDEMMTTFFEVTG